MDPDDFPGDGKALDHDSLEGRSKRKKRGRVPTLGNRLQLIVSETQVPQSLGCFGQGYATLGMSGLSLKKVLFRGNTAFHEMFLAGMILLVETHQGLSLQIVSLCRSNVGRIHDGKRFSRRDRLAQVLADFLHNSRRAR